MLGRLRFEVGGKELRLNNRKSRALLAYLALSEKGEETRERLIGMLWSETEEARARASLRQALYEINSALEGAGLAPITASKLSVALTGVSVQVDLMSVLETAREETVHPLLLEREHPIEELLVEYEGVDPAFRVWLLAKRQALHDRLVRHLEKAMRNPQNSHEARTRAAHAVLNLDLTHEESARVLMTLRAASGDIGGALAIYKRLWDVLDQEYDVEPSKETQELVATLKLGQPDASAPVIAVALPVIVQPLKPRLIIAVGQFDAKMIEGDRDYILQGFRRELIANLVRFREWSVRDGIASLSSGRVSSTDLEYILEGTAIRQSDGYRLVVTLLNTRDQEYIWSDEYRLTLEDRIDSQQLLVRRIASALNVYLSTKRLAQVSRQEAPALKAYDRWLHGQDLLLNWSPRAFREARKLFQSIVAESPDFSPAYSTLAQLQNSEYLIHPGVYRDARSIEMALSYAREATRLDPIDSRAHLSLGWAHAMAQQHDLAEAHHLIARDLNENDGWTATSVALGHAMRGQKDAARDASRRALALTLSPLTPHWVYRTQTCCLTAAYSDAVAAAKFAAGEFNPTLSAWKIAALGHTGAPEAGEEARLYLEQARQQWMGSDSPTDERIAHWTLQCFPIKEQADWQAFRDGLGAAGLPVSGIQQSRW